ncbi:DNA-3-methyladenine glycosylase, partial [archaeon]|nr:DNA-3-methyladenine glycosylase [archaeon]
MKELSKEFFKQDTVKVAKKLLGKIIVIGDLKGRIV